MGHRRDAPDHPAHATRVPSLQEPGNVWAVASLPLQDAPRGLRPPSRGAWRDDVVNARLVPERGGSKQGRQVRSYSEKFSSRRLGGFAKSARRSTGSRDVYVIGSWKPVEARPEQSHLHLLDDA